jgi:hypothetical protein
VGVADALNKNVWVLEDVNASFHFPIPNAHHYLLYSSTDQNSLQYLQTVIRSYSKNLGGALLGGLVGLALSTNPLVAIAGLLIGSQLDVPARPVGAKLQCPYKDCGIVFEFHNTLRQFYCPACRRGVQLP